MARGRVSDGSKVVGRWWSLSRFDLTKLQRRLGCLLWSERDGVWWAGSSEGLKPKSALKNLDALPIVGWLVVAD